MDTEAKGDLLNKINEKKESKTKPHLLNRVLNSLFTVCNQILYKKSVMRCIKNKYPCQTFFNILMVKKIYARQVIQKS